MAMKNKKPQTIKEQLIDYISKDYVCVDFVEVSSQIVDTGATPFRPTLEQTRKQTLTVYVTNKGSKNEANQTG